MSKYQEITEARRLLELPETATMQRVKTNYRALLERWHPDRCRDEVETCNEMTRKIIAAYEMIVDYCRRYEYSFKEKDVKRHLSPDEWWRERFGDPLWGDGVKESE